MKMSVSVDDKIRELAQSGKRSTELIANFINGYASGWYMAVRESFHPQLDIKHTARVVTKSTGEGKDELIFFISRSRLPM